MAASGVNVKMGVSGISQFKQNLNQAKSAVKTLDAQLALTEKQFKASGDAESYMAEKGELLKAKLEKQNQIVNSCQKALDEMTKNGVDRASKSYQDMYQQMINAKGAMIDTEQAMNNIAGAAEDADVAVSGMDDGLKRIDQGISFQNVTGALGSITDSMEAVMKKAWEVGKAITRNVLGAGNWADDLQTRAAYFGLKPEQLQRMEKTADLIDTSVDAIVNAKRKMNKGLGSGSDSIAQALEDLGLGTIVSTDPEEMFWEIGDAIMHMGDAYTQEEAAQKLFGRSWHELVPLFETGREEYEKLNASWSVVPQEQIDALQELDDKYKTLENEFETVKLQFDAAIAEGLTPVMETLVGLMQEFNKYLETPEGQAMLESLGNAVASLFDDLAKVTPEDVINSITGVIGSIKEGLEWIADNRDTVVGAVEAFVLAWGGLKVTKGMTTALQLINGVKGLLGGGGGAAASSGGAAGGTAAGGAAAGGGSSAGWLAGAKTRLAEFGGLALDASPFILFIDGVIHDMQVINEANEQAAEEAARLEGKTAEFQGKGAGSGLMEAWKLLTDPYTANTGGGAFFQSLIEHNKAWMTDGDTVMDALAEALDDDTWDRMVEILDTLSEGGQIYDASTVQLYQDMKDQLERMIDLTDGTSGTASWLSGPLQNLNSMADLPQKVKQAVEAAIGTMNVYLDGQKVGELTAPYVSEELAGAVLND